MKLSDRRDRRMNLPGASPKSLRLTEGREENEDGISQYILHQLVPNRAPKEWPPRQAFVGFVCLV